MGTTAFTGTVTLAERYAFALTGSMNSSRDYHSATMFENGVVLVTGGRVSSPLSSAELYDPVAGRWTPAATMAAVRATHTSTLLANGKVLVAGGYAGGFTVLNTAEIYDPTTGAWTPTGSMVAARRYHTATLLNDGRVLVAGGEGANHWLNTAELYDPDTGVWTATGSMSSGRQMHPAVKMDDGRVIVVGGDGPGSNTSEIYDPGTGIWWTTGDMKVTPRRRLAATILSDGRVLASGGCDDYGTVYRSAELYDPTSDTWVLTGTMIAAHQEHQATLLRNGRVLVTGGSAEVYDPDTEDWLATEGSFGYPYHSATLLDDGRVLLAGSDRTAQIAAYLPANTLTGVLTLPSGWLTSWAMRVQFAGSASAASVDAGALSNDGTSWGDWIPATDGAIVTTSWNVTADGEDRPIYLRLRDIYGQVAAVVTGTVDVDTLPPESSMAALPATSPIAINLSWTGSDVTSGVAGYDLQVRAGLPGTWADVLTGTTSTSTTYSGQAGVTYYFRVRARDLAGNIEPWPSDYDASTVVDTDSPTATIIVNHGAFATTSRAVTLSLSASDVLGSVSEMRLSDDGTNWQAWLPYAGTAPHTLPAGDGEKRVFAQFRDQAGNVSDVVSDSIVLDEAAGTELSLSINDGALWTNTVDITLSLGAPAGTTQMQVSNDGGFAGAVWEPFSSRKQWRITGYGSYVIPRTVYYRTRIGDGSTSATASDDIILDVTPPSGSIEVMPVGGAAAATLQPRSVPARSVAALGTIGHTVYLPLSARNLLVCSTPPSGVPNLALVLSATDDVSGVADFQISNSTDFGCSTWRTFVTSTLWYAPDSVTEVYARFRDHAGNVSAAVVAVVP